MVWVAWIWNYLLDAIKLAIAEGFGFLILAFVGGLILRSHIVRGIEQGFRSVAVAVADSLVKSIATYILPEIIRLRELTESQLVPSGEKVVKEKENIPTTPEIGKFLELIQKDIEEGRFPHAEEQLLQLREQHPQDFRVLVALFSLYRHPKYQKKADALETLLKAENDFKGDARFYRYLAHAYMELKGILTKYQAKKNALDAANKCLELSPTDPDSYKILGLVYFVFDNLAEAITNTKKALNMAQESGDKEKEMHCKNNLAFYYATEGKPENKEKALAYAREALNNSPDHPYFIDTVGYVLLKYSDNKKDVEEAVGLFNRALEIDPYDPDILQHLQESYSKLKNLPPGEKIRDA